MNAYTYSPIISSGLPTPVNDVIIIQRDKVVPPGIVGEVWIRGPNVMKSYWRDQGLSALTTVVDDFIKLYNDSCY